MITQLRFLGAHKRVCPEMFIFLFANQKGIIKSDQNIRNKFYNFYIEKALKHIHFIFQDIHVQRIQVTYLKVIQLVHDRSKTMTYSNFHMGIIHVMQKHLPVSMLSRSFMRFPYR